VEQGAHHGDFARDVLEAIRDVRPDLFSVVRYLIVEPFPILQECQEAALQPFADRVGWKKSVTELAPFSGIHFSNELLDAMPVHLISRSENGWEEKLVEAREDGFNFVRSPIADPDLRLHLKTIPRPVDPKYETEVNLAALKWIETISQKLFRGYVFTIDYGYSRTEYYAPERNQGTLRACANHRILPSPFSAVGHADLTAHLDWTSIAVSAERSGFAVAGFTDQHHFVTGLLSTPMADQFGVAADSKSRRALQTLLHPELLGRTFQVLTLAKDVPADQSLSGFRFMRDVQLNA
jgi:SAM-dependent MidA family methyltransferase